MTLTPSFDSDVTEYAATTSNNTNKVTATATYEDAEIAITLNDNTPVTNGGTATWSEGENTLEITVSGGGEETVYTVMVTKE